MNTQLQTIKNTSGNPEYVLLPIELYNSLKKDIDQIINKTSKESNYAIFNPADFIKNPLALARMRAGITQTLLAKYLKVSQAYISKIENDEYNVTEKLYAKVKKVIDKLVRAK